VSQDWTYRRWQLDGERTTVGDITFDSTVHCGAGQGFQEIAPGHFRFRSRAGLAPYAWRLHFCIESPGDGREVTLEVADFNHFGQELWQEGATVVSRDEEQWDDLGIERIRIVPWTPTGVADDDDSIDDGWHPPYGLQYRVRLDAPKLWLASPTPYTLAHCRDHLQALADRCDFFSVEEIGRTHYYGTHGFPLLMTKVAKAGRDDGKIRVVVVAGEHAAESAGMYACEGLLEELLRTHDLLADFSFWVVPVVNVDGVAFGRTYHNVDPGDPLGRGVNLNRDWRERTQPETQAIWRLIKEVRPHCYLSLHNGRHRRELELFSLPDPRLATLMGHLREHLPLPLEHWRPATSEGMGSVAVREAALAETGICFETLLLRKVAECRTFEESYRRVGMCLLRGLVAGLRELHGKPQLSARSEALRAGPLRCRAADFVAQLPSFYYYDLFDGLRDHRVHSFEVNGLPLRRGYYDVRLKMADGCESLCVMRGKPEAEDLRASDGWAILTSIYVPARKIAFEFEHPGGDLPFEEVLISPEGLPLEAANADATLYDRYVRNIRFDERAHFRDWQPFYERLMDDSFGAPDLEAMCDEILDWVAGRQIRDADDPHFGASYSEEDKYDARDAAAAAAAFARKHKLTGEQQWLDRARDARQYAYRSQMHEPGNEPRHGGFVHMVHGIWGGHFTRLRPPYPAIDGVDTCIIVHQLCRAADLGLSMGEQDLAVIRDAAQWVANNEMLPGVFRHHEGALNDCQNANSLGLSTLVRAYHTLRAAGADAPGQWLEAAERGIEHYAEGQELIGVWPYFLAHVGYRGQAYDFENVPDHGIGLVHLTRVCDKAPLAGRPGLHDLLKRAARWYLGISWLDCDTIDLEYNKTPDLGNDICFSGFTWCRFTAATTLLRIARLTGEVEPWRHLALRLMEHVRRKRWQTGDPTHAPVVSHARPEAKLATWCQTAEWDASMLGEMIEDLAVLEV